MSAPRINNWAALVVELESLILDPWVLSVQSDSTKAGLQRAKTVLHSIYCAHWADVDIGYPNALAILSEWNRVPCELTEDVDKTMRHLDLFFRSIRLDMLVVKYAKMDIGEENV